MSAVTSPQPVAETARPVTVSAGDSSTNGSSSLVQLDPGIREQLQPLVNQLFLSTQSKGIRHVVVFGVESDQRLGAICEGMAQILASRTRAEIAVVQATADLQKGQQSSGDRIEGNARQVASGLWLVKVDLGSDCWSIQGHDPTGPANIRRLHAEFDSTITHTPPLNQSSLGAVMGCFSDGVILVVRAGKTRRASALSSLQLLRRNKIRVLGVILDDRRFPIPQSLYDKL